MCVAEIARGEAVEKAAINLNFGTFPIPVFCVLLGRP